MASEVSSKRRALKIAGLVCAILCGAIIFTLSCIPGSSFPSAKAIWSVVIHFTEYACFGFCLAYAWSNPKRGVLFIFIAALLCASVYGALDEVHQLFTPYRCSDWRDWVVDTCGGALGAGVAVAIMALCGWFKKRGGAL